MQIKKFTKLIIVSKNWPNDPKVGCKSPSNSIEFTKMSGDLENELEQLEGDLERNEVFELQMCKMTIVGYLLMFLRKLSS